MALVHASPESLWRAPSPEAGAAELAAVYAPLEKPVVVYGHIHRSFVRNVGEMTVVNSGSVGLPYDGDRRAAYLLLDDFVPTIRRVNYDIDRELKDLAGSAIPHVSWIAKMLETAAPSMP
jgi:diadenosine tetraphosphatase ApaH/serine/threonine PP2A family protein phosphatase